MTKLTLDGKELGCSALPTLILGRHFQNTKRSLWDEQFKASKGVEQLPRKETYAMARGNILEPAIAQLAMYNFRTLSDAKMEQWIPKEAFRKPEVKLGASIDYILQVEDGVLPITYEDTTIDYFGNVIHEIKSDKNHQGFPHLEWILQVQGQMFCSDVHQAIISVFDQTMNTKHYPVLYDPQIVEEIVKAVNEFWDKIEEGVNYDEDDSSINDNTDSVDLTTMLNKTNHNLDELCTNYNLVTKEINAQKKTQSEIKGKIVSVMNHLSVKRGSTNLFNIVSEDITKHKKKMVDTGETYQSHSFKIKERKSDEQINTDN